MTETSLPSVTAVIPAHARPVELRAAIEAVRSQEYGGDLDVLVVYDRAEPDMTLAAAGDRPVNVIANERTDGLAGARNTGILAATGTLIAFCDDDDTWEPGKLAKQVAAFATRPSAHLVTTAIVVDFDDHSTVRLAGTDTVEHAALVRSRMSMLHSSTLLFRASALRGELGLINEDIPGSQNEDWDILLRSSAIHPISHIDEPLVRVAWGRGSHFSRRWDTKIASSEWMLEHHPDVAADDPGAARLMGQIAFAHAASGNRREALAWSRKALRRRPLEWRAVVAAAVTPLPRSSEWVLNILHRFGRGV
ncbi:MAG: glycosyltransferase family 2 protein [Ilumatobacter sp.]